MSDIVISVENLGKKYRIRHQKPERYTALRDVLADKFAAPWRALASTLRNAGKATNGNGSNLPAPSSTLQTPTSQEDFWALRDVSFEVRRGEVVGVIGRNGAGKSTLLKLLSRITEPTTGQIEIEGRVASLLEVGTGFHPELTGRENIFLNGAILGMTRGEIRNKFDEIVAFAGLEKFLDTPVKRYSSGMYVRLAFAVAAHLEPEILVVDEVLAVGDAEFQKKCLGKMNEVARGGRTVLFVSHQLAAVGNLCEQCLLLESGRLKEVGRTSEVTRTYREDSLGLAAASLRQRRDRQGNGMIRFTAAYAECGSEPVRPYWITGQPGRLVLRFENPTGKELKKLHVSVGLDDPAGQRILLLSSDLTENLGASVPAHVDHIEISLGCVPLMPGTYGFTVYSTVQGDVTDWIQNAGTLTVEEGDFFGTGRLASRGQGNFLVLHHFVLRGGPSTSYYSCPK